MHQAVGDMGWVAVRQWDTCASANTSGEALVKGHLYGQNGEYISLKDCVYVYCVCVSVSVSVEVV